MGDAQALGRGRPCVYPKAFGDPNRIIRPAAVVPNGKMKDLPHTPTHTPTHTHKGAQAGLASKKDGSASVEGIVVEDRRTCRVRLQGDKSLGRGSI